MNKEEQNLVIAEFLGTHKVSREMASWNKPKVPEENIYVVTDKNGKRAMYWTETVSAEMYDNDYIHVTRYNSDLNAMHEAEKMLNYEQAEEFVEQLYLADQKNNLAENPPPWRFNVASATAAQRAEAFLKTIGKWEDGK